MLQSEKLYAAYKNLLGWQQFYDPDEITISDELVASDTGEFYQEKHSALQLNYISALLPANYPLDKYLTDKVKGAINNIFNDVLQYRQVNNYGKTLLEKAQLLNRHSWAGDTIINEGRFVGYQIKVRALTGLQTVIEEIGLQLSAAQDITMYLFHSERTEPVAMFELNTQNATWTWKNVATALLGVEPLKHAGGVYVLGYYQDDLTSQAVNYSNFNWDKGECSGCNNTYYGTWKSIREHFFVHPIYVPRGNYEKGVMFDLKKASYANDRSWGINLKLTVKCDLTDFFVENRFAFKNLLAYKVAHMILNDMKFSQETNHVQENLEMKIIRDVEGDKETNMLNVGQMYSKELKAVTFNISSINNRCLGDIKDTYQPRVGVL